MPADGRPAPQARPVVHGEPQWLGSARREGAGDRADRLHRPQPPAVLDRAAGRCSRRAAARGHAAARRCTRARADRPARARPAADHGEARPDVAGGRRGITATGTVGRRGDANATTLPVDLYAGTVIVTAIPRSERCPSAPAAANGPHTDYDNVSEARFSETQGILGAFQVARKLPMCGYLTAKRHTPAGVRTVTVARAATTVTGVVPDTRSGGNDDVELIFGGIMAWIFVIGLIAAIMRVGSWLLNDTPAGPATCSSHASPRRFSPSPPSNRVLRGGWLLRGDDRLRGRVGIPAA
jgi:hypothetical protein